MFGVAIVLAVTSLLTWAVTIVLVPQNATSIFRYSLWKLRDELRDDMFDQRLPDAPVVRDMVDILESMILRPENLQLSGFVVLRFLRKRIRSNMGTPAASLAGLSEPEQERFIRVLHEAYRSLRFKTIAGSPFGAFLFPFLLVYFNYFEADPRNENREFRRLREIGATVGSTGGKTRELLASVG